MEVLVLFFIPKMKVYCFLFLKNEIELTETSAASEKGLIEVLVVDGHGFNEGRTHA